MRPFHAEPIPIEKGYVRLAIVKEEEQREKMWEAFSAEGKTKEDQKPFEDKRITCFEQIYGTKTPAELNDIFAPDKDKKGFNRDKAPKRLLVLGRAGIGKSTLCQYMAYQWASPDAEVKLWQENGKEKFKLVIWVPLRKLLNYPADATIADFIWEEYIPTNNLREKTLTKEAIYSGLRALNSDDILYVLDGYDEVAGRTNGLIEHLLSQENIILTSRPHGINEYLVSEAAKPMDKKFENIGFLDEDIEHYIDAFFGEGEENKRRGESLNKFLKEHPNIWGIAHIPINLLLICVAWKDNYNRINLKAIKDVTLTDLYYGLIINLGRRYLDKRGVTGLVKFNAEKILNHEKCKPILAILSRIAFEQMESDSLLILKQKLDEKQLRKFYPQHEILRDDVIQFGVLTSTTAETDKENAEFYFVHLTFQEFLAAWHIAERVRSNDPAIKEDISKNKYSRRHEMMWWYVAGLLKEETQVLERFFDILEDDPRDLAQIYHQTLLMHCMNECQMKINIKVKAKFLDDLCQSIEVAITEKPFFYRTLSIHLGLSHVVANQEKILHKFYELLGNENPLIKFNAIIALINASMCTQKYMSKVQGLLKDPSDRVRIAAIKFFGTQKNLPQEISAQIVQLLFDRENINIDELIGVIDFFKTRKDLPSEIIHKIFIFFDIQFVSKDIIEILENQPSVPIEILSKLVPVLGSPGVDMLLKQNIAYLFCKQPSLPEEILALMASLLTNPREESWVRQGIISIFIKLTNSSGKIPTQIDLLLNDLGKEQKEAVFYLFSEYGNSSKDILFKIAMLLNISMEWLRNIAIDFFYRQPDLPEEIITQIVLLIEDKKDLGWDIINFFNNPRILSEKALNHLLQFVGSSNKFIRDWVISIIVKQTNIPQKIFDQIMLFFQNPNEEVKITVIDFFRIQKKLPQEIVTQILPLLENSSDNVRIAVIYCFSEQQNLYQEIADKIIFLTEHPNEKVRMAALYLLTKQVNLSGLLIQAIMKLLKDPNDEIRKKVVDFFSSRPVFPEENFDQIQILFEDPNYYLRSAAVYFFSRQSNVSLEILNKIIKLLEDEKFYVRRSTIMFFRNRADIPKDALNRITVLLKEHDPLETTNAATELFIHHPNKSMTLEKLGDLLRGQRKDFVRKTMLILEKEPLSNIMRIINAREKSNLSSGFLYALIAKTLMMNIPVYVSARSQIQVGGDGVINFESEEELAEFVKKFQQVFREFTGLNLDGKLEEFSQAGAMSKFGQFSVSPVISDDEREELSDKEKNKWCAVL